LSLPGVGAVFVEHVELLGRQQLAPVDAGLDGAETPQYPDLLDVADDGRDAEPFQLRVDGVQAADEVLQEEVERLRQADQLPTVDVEGGHLRSPIVDQPALVVLGLVGGLRRRRVDRLVEGQVQGQGRPAGSGEQARV